MYILIYIYIYIRGSKRDTWGQREWGHCKCNVLFTEILVATPVECVFPNMPGQHLLSNLAIATYFCSGPISVDPICP